MRAAPEKLLPSTVVTVTPSLRSSKFMTMASETSSTSGMRLHSSSSAWCKSQRVVQVDAVDDDVGMLEACVERFPGRNRHEHVTREGVAHQHGRRAIGLGH